MRELSIEEQKKHGCRWCADVRLLKEPVYYIKKNGESVCRHGRIVARCPYKRCEYRELEGIKDYEKEVNKIPKCDQEKFQPLTGVGSRRNLSPKKEKAWQVYCKQFNKKHHIGGTKKCQTNT